MWAVLEHVFPVHSGGVRAGVLYSLILGNVRAGVHWVCGQRWSRCSLVIWAVLEQVVIGYLGSVGAGVHWSVGQCHGDTCPLLWFSLF